MIEARGNLHSLARDQATGEGSDSDNTIGNLVEIIEPESPIHPELEYEVLVEHDDVPSVDGSVRYGDVSSKSHLSKDIKLLISFIFLVITGAGNAVSLKLQSLPMYNYPNFLNIYANLMYIPICFAYIIPVARFGWFKNSISPGHIRMSKNPFIVMGALDCLATSMQIFAAVYLPGPLLVLLPQAAIPCSMVLSRYVLGERFSWLQYGGAAVVLAGLAVVLEPVWTNRHSPSFYCEAYDTQDDCTICQVESSEDACLSHRTADVANDTIWQLASNETNNNGSLCQWIAFDEASREKETLTFVWSFVVIASTIPLTLSAIYKQKALGEGEEVDPVYLNGWIAVFQLFFSIILAVPAGLLGSPPVSPLHFVDNLWDGVNCFMGHGTIDTGCHPDSWCSFHAAFFVNLCLGCNIVYTVCMMFVLKYGSSSLLFLALTLMIPVGNLAFSMPFMPETETLHVSDMLGMVVIMTGLVLYRFSAGTPVAPTQDSNDVNPMPGSEDRTWDDALRQPLLQNDAIGDNEEDEPAAGDALHQPLLQSGDI